MGRDRGGLLELQSQETMETVRLHSVDLRAVLRDEASSYNDLKLAIIAAMDLKPERHYFYDHDHTQPVRLMNVTGG